MVVAGSGTSAARREQYGKSENTRGQRTRALLMKHAREVFERDGYVDARVADITASAGVSHGSFYTYFESKQEILRAIVEEISDDYATASRTVSGELADDPDPAHREWVRIETANRRFLDVYRRNRGMMKIYEQVSAMDPYVEEQRLIGRRRSVARIERSIRRLQDLGMVDRSLDAHIAASALAAMVGNFAYFWLALGEDYQEAAALHTLTRLWANALGLDETVTDAKATEPSASS
ncbi:TetR/AcrR family transcriptional regulator [Arthrobacter sp. STN4]|uniref:TetR/AcrR family transcriptional regulator n=1 Tax=Arthrobacter sp. STN4 TaxID=2923276 RepID=UPI002119DB59|nr:TetR/AcrR family transcriptional regulator [Arthrobacter sp. STN4]MCQ9163746.1 TetR/AcrR family transcriptional regulator [Arthrobacter sp. STN4]